MNNFELPTPDGNDVWHRIAAEKRPILIYGMGNGADKLLAEFAEYNIEYADFFASDGFVRGHSFHGKRVLSFSEAVNKYDDFAIVVSFASNRDEVIERIAKLSNEYTVYIPDMPVVGEDYFTAEFYREKYNDAKYAQTLFSDVRSKKVFSDIVNFKLTGDYKYLANSSDSKESVFSLMSVDKVKYYTDAGAYNGDTVREILDLGAKLEKAVAIEPDAKTYRRLIKYAERESRVNVECVPAALCDKVGGGFFFSSGNRNSSMSNFSYEHKEEYVRTDTIDNILCNFDRMDYIKYDVEGVEKEALIGSLNTIERLNPMLSVSAYHRSEDIFSLIVLLKNICPNYNFYLRKFKCFPAWEVNIIAIPRNKNL